MKIPAGRRLRVLNQDQVESIHSSTLDVLWKVGVVVYEKTAFRLLKDAGAEVDEKKCLVRIPSHLVKEVLEKTPKSFTIYARNPKNNVRVEDGEVHFGPMIGRRFILDSETGNRRLTNMEDVARLTRLASALEYYTLPHSAVLMPSIEGVPDPVCHAHAYFVSLRNSEKPVKGTGRDRKHAVDCIRMASALAGCAPEELSKKPNIFSVCNPISPLQHNVGQTEGLLEYTKHGIPVDIASEPQSGASSPVTLAGTLVIQNAEILSGLVIAQLNNPGAPVFYGTAATVFDMKSSVICKGAIEAGLLNVATAQMAQFYGIPSRGTACDTESKLLDIQAGFEKMSVLLMAALAGVNYIWYPGTLEYALTVSLESILIDHEMCGMVRRALGGIDVSPETLSLDVIGRVGPGGHFLGQRQTLELLAKEHYMPRLSDRRNREAWEKDGGKDLWKVAREEVKRILREYEPQPLEKEVEANLKSILAEIEKRELGGRTGG